MILALDQDWNSAFRFAASAEQGKKKLQKISFSYESALLSTQLPTAAPFIVIRASIYSKKSLYIAVGCENPGKFRIAERLDSCVVSFGRFTSLCTALNLLDDPE